MALLNLNFQLAIRETEDRSGDEPRLEFAFVTGTNNAEVVIRHTPELASNIDEGRTIRGSIDVPFAPDDDKPYLGLAVRALEADNSRESDRARDRNDLTRMLRSGLTPTFAAGSTPSAGALRRIVFGAPVHDNRGDDDDRIGVGAAVFPLVGVGLDDRDNGEVVARSSMRFREDDADWVLNCQLVKIELI